MALKFETSLVDVGKFLLIIFVVIFLWVNVNKFLNTFNKSDSALLPRIERLEEGLVKVSGQENTAELKRLIEELRQEQSIALKAVKDANQKVDELTKVVTKLKADSKMQSGSTYKDPEKDTRSFSDTVVSRKDAKGEELPMSRVFYHPDIEENPWTVQNFPLDLHTNILQTQQENGEYSNYVETYFTNDFVKSSKGKKYYFDSDVSWAKREIKDKKFRFNMRLGLTGNVTGEEVYPGLDISFASYGKTKRDMDWRFLTLGVGTDNEDIYGYCYPVQYNIGNHIPLVENVFFGPFIGTGPEGEVNYGGGISVLF
jgi:hypothetical protein